MARYDLMQLTDNGWQQVSNKFHADQFEAKDKMLNLMEQNPDEEFGVLCVPGYSPVRSRAAYMLYRSDWERE